MDFTGQQSVEGRENYSHVLDSVSGQPQPSLVELPAPVL